MEKQKLPEIGALILLLVVLAWISFDHVEQSISVVKNLFSNSVKYLLKNYDLYHHSFKEFLFQTGSFHSGCSSAGWHTLFYLLPLFMFCDFGGGLSLEATYFFSITVSLGFLVLFYWWIKKYWGRTTAFFAAFFLGFSAIFQEIARSGNFHAYSILMVTAWILYCYSNAGEEKPFYFVLLGFLTGILWYGYGLDRLLTIVAVARTWWAGKISRRTAFGLFAGGMAVALIPGIIILFEQHKNHHGPWHLLFIDRENILDNKAWDIRQIFRQFLFNLRVFDGRLQGLVQPMDGPMSWKPYARFLNPCLALPMWIGMWRTFVLSTFRQDRASRLLAFIALMIYVTPLLTAGWGYDEPRRALFYIIPIYCFIGIGCRDILEWINEGIRRRNVRGLVGCILAIGIYAVVNAEMSFARDNIIFSSRDLGLLSFADQIKHSGIGGNIYYLEKRSIYNGTKESDVLRLALMDHGQELLGIENGGPGEKLSSISKSFVVARSPGISDKDFRNWTLLNKFKCTLVLESGMINLRQGDRFIWVQGGAIKIAPFRLYAVDRLMAEKKV